MRCPFPGMDPYLERPAIWPDFHDRLITYLCEALQPLLRPRYAALTRDRRYVVEADRPIYPDVALVQARREPVIHIIEPAAADRIITAIEVLSPDNKSPGPGRDSYCQKREELWSPAWGRGATSSRPRGTCPRATSCTP